MTTLKEIALELFVMGICAPAALLLVVMAVGQFLALSRAAS